VLCPPQKNQKDYDQVAYVAKTRLGRMVGCTREFAGQPASRRAPLIACVAQCYVFDCGAYSNQVLATIGQAFVTAGEQQALEDEEFETLDQEYAMFAQEGGMTDREYQDLYGKGVRSQAARFPPTRLPVGHRRPAGPKPLGVGWGLRLLSSSFNAGSFP
jgi:hypothetical protein